MAYQVLARKWRPQNFHTMVGQEHVLRALVHALDEQRLHHAYLFAGTRGVGKTTIARILARCLNCEEGVSSTPCGVCSSCVEITQGRFVDLIEVDAASRTKVEDTRELLDNVQYAPTRGRFKVYLIDEVHMLSTSSFNALLKTLEEPPPHVKFLLATTDPQKLPITVLSRCLQFNLKNMPAEQVAGHLRNVLTSETIPFAEASLWQLGRAAKGSMRDALSLTDQAIAFCGGNLTESAVNQMLGSIDQGKVVAIVSQLQKGNASELLRLIAELAEQGQDFFVALEDLLSLLHQVAICQVLPDAPVSVQFDKAKVLELAQNTSPADVQLFYQMGIMARKDLELAPDLQAGFEMALLRMLAFRPQQHAGQRHVLANESPSQEAMAIEAVEPQMAQELMPPVEIAKTLDLSDKLKASTQLKSSLAAETSALVDTRVALEPIATPIAEPIKAQINESELQSMGALVLESPPWEEEPLQGQSAQLGQLESELAAARAPASDLEERPPTQAGELQAKVAQVIPQPSAQAPLEPTSVLTSVTSPKQLNAITAGLVPDLIPDLIPPKPRHDWSLADLNDDNWIKIFNDLNLQGMTHGIAANMVFAHRQGTQLQFTLQQGQSSMLNETHQARILESLQQMFACDLSLSISIGKTHTETPFDRRQRREKEHQNEAITALQNDPNVASLTTAFNGQLDVDSVLAINPIET